MGFFLSLHQTNRKTCKKMKQLTILLLLIIGLNAQAQSGLDKRQFAKYWQVESESPDYKVTFSGDTCEILSPKGLTLWRTEKMQQGMTVEYDACVVDEGKPGDRLSDMNCFWLASDSHAKGLFSKAQWRSGIFTRCYTLQMYYLGYGGNHNTTTRFRRYDGNEAGVEDASKRPAILKEYTDAAHLLKANHWYHIKIESTLTGRTRFYIDGECIVDYQDPQPLKEGWFGFRTTLSRTIMTNFKAYQTASYAYTTTGVPLHWVGEKPTGPVPVSFGVPFAQGELKDVTTLALSDETPVDAWVNARWPDGSVKWAGLSAVVSPIDGLFVTSKQKKVQKNSPSIVVSNNQNGIQVNTGRLTVSITKKGRNLIDSLCIDGKRVGGVATLIASTDAAAFQSKVTKVDVERMGKVSAVIKAEGVHRSENGREWLPFTVRLYFYLGSDQMNLVHTFIYNGDAHRDQIRSIGLRFQVPMREATLRAKLLTWTSQQ